MERKHFYNLPSVEPNIDPNSMTPSDNNGCLAIATMSCPT
jgi:hypothetical protein